MKNFCKDLRKHVTKIINYDKNATIDKGREKIL